MIDTTSGAIRTQIPLPRYVEVETSRRCNRTCTWCPNSESNARRTQELMDFPLYRRIVDELGRLDYAGYLAFHNYNEPLLNGRILDEIGYAKAAMPKVRPAIYTNGDVLDCALFKSLIRAGVMYIRVTRYPRHANTPPSYNTIQGWLRRAGLLDEYQWQYKPVRQGLAAVMEVLGFKAEVISPAIVDAYNNRGGSVTTLPVLAKTRTEPCLMTATSAVIDYRGRMKMCCCVYPEVPAHTGYVIGDLHSSTFTDLWGSVQMNAYREAHGRADWSLSPACATCVQPLPETRQ